MTADGGGPPVRTGRLAFIDGLRGVAIILMVVNHTARWWMDGPMTWERYRLIYGSLLHPAPLFLFLAGFAMPIAFRRAPAPPPLGPTMLRFLGRGLQIIGGGLLLNLLVFRDQPPWSGGVLQTIGLAVILVAPTLWILHRPAARWAVLGLAVALYLGFVAAYEGLTGWVAAHPAAAQVLFLDFPPWPWVAPAFVGIVVGWVWLDVRAGGPEREARFFGTAAALGAAGVAAWVAHEWLRGMSPVFHLRRDFILNHHWTPRGATLFLVGGGLGLFLALTWYLMERRGCRFPWLVTLGQTALMLYFLHQVIALTLVNEALGWRFNHWGAFAAANLAFLVGLVGLARAWLWLRPRLSDTLARWRPARSP